MHLSVYVAALSTCLGLVSAVPATDSAVKVDPALRLIKTSPTDPGKWVTEEEKIVNYAAKKIDYVDITDIKDPEVLQRLSAPTTDNARVAAAITYPTTLTHQTEANALIAQTNTNGPKSWLTTLTK